MIRTAAATWALAIAMVAQLWFQVAWWHPYCDRLDDGPGQYGYGFPLPYAAPTGATSLTWFVAPWAYAIDILLIAGAIYPLAGLILRRLRRGDLARRRLPWGAGAVLALIVAFLALVGRDAFSPRWSPEIGSDSYLSYRPAAWAERAGHRACDGGSGPP